MSEIETTTLENIPIGTFEKLRSEFGRISKFCIVGVVNTLLDFIILNLVHFHLGVTLILANLISTSAAMIFSFFANRHVVFAAKKGHFWKQAIRFWVITAAGIYGLQSLVFWTFSHPLENFSLRSADLIHVFLPGHFSSTFIMDNGIKVLATFASLIWNYIFYKKLVFAAEKE